MDIRRLIIEMIFVGLSLVIVSLGITIIEDQSLKSLYIWPMIRGVFMTGAAVHFIYEILGINAYYAKNYKPIFNK